ncbi:response regulator transcription factor [Dactylosporangium salmoneum]|uniref:Response regulator transcription factor n=1 Tax=Dactylosporangium salmoneum TaxID=53361 RepID=A0ABN3G5I4_9ACTN
MTVRVVVADDQVLIRVGLCGIVEAAADLTVVGQAGTGFEAVDAVHRLAPHVVLMDVRMPGLDGIEATRQITASTSSRVLMLTTFDLDEYIYGALRAGASGFLLKDAPPHDLHAAIRVVAGGEALLAPTVTRRLIATFATQHPPPAPLPAGLSSGLAGLTDRERQVLLLVADGLTNAEIGARLHITAGTAKTHVARLLHKLAARDRVQLVILAHRAGLTPGG